MLRIERVTGRTGIKEFVLFPFKLYRNDPYYSPEPIRHQMEHFSDKNPFVRRSRISYLLAKRDRETVGRVAAFVNPTHIEYHGERAGFFGFFESVDDLQVAGALMESVVEFLRAEGMELVRGPMNFSTNEYCGVLVEGFERPPSLMTPYNPPYYSRLFEELGFQKAKDLLAFESPVPQSLWPKILKVAARAERHGIRVRPVSKRDLYREMKVFMQIYHEAWKDNWGYLPMSDEELQYAVKRLRPLIVEDLMLVAEAGREPVGFLGVIPDYALVLRKMRGRMDPVALLKALYYSRKIRRLRLLLLGVRPGYRMKGVEALLFREGFRAARGRYQSVEFSWILEDNLPVLRLIEMTGASLSRRFRVYERPAGVV